MDEVASWGFGNWSGDSLQYLVGPPFIVVSCRGCEGDNSKKKSKEDSKSSTVVPVRVVELEKNKCVHNAN